MPKYDIKRKAGKGGSRVDSRARGDEWNFKAGLEPQPNSFWQDAFDEVIYAPGFTGQKVWLRVDLNSREVTIDFACKNDRLPGFVAHIDGLIAETNKRANAREAEIAAQVATRDNQQEREQTTKAEVQEHLDSL